MQKVVVSIDGYLTSLTPDRRTALQKLRQVIRKLAPEVEECISYSMPAFRLKGHVVAGFLATKKGCSYYPFSGTTLGSVADALDGYDRTKSALHFDPKRGLPVALVRRLLQARIAETEQPKARRTNSSKAAKKSPAIAKRKPTIAKRK